MGKTLFISQNPLNRCENLAAVWEVYDGPKEFRCGQENMVEAEAEGFSVVVCDALPKRINGKDKCKLVNIDHGLSGGKLYGLDEGDKPWVDPVAFAQIDYAIASSRAGVPIVARTFGISTQRVLPLGAPRTDKYFNDTPPDDEDRYKYLYAPTFRRGDGDGRLPDINWGLLESLLEGDEEIAVQRHYYTDGKLVDGSYERIYEFEPTQPSYWLLRGCDVVITDYSSIMFDAYLLGKPVVLLTDDMGDYLECRGMYYEYPHSYCSRFLDVEGNEGKLVEMLREAADNGMGPTEERCRLMTGGKCDGHSTERVCDLIRRLA